MMKRVKTDGRKLRNRERKSSALFLEEEESYNVTGAKHSAILFAFQEDEPLVLADNCRD